MATTDQFLEEIYDSPLARYTIASEALYHGVVAILCGEPEEKFFWDIARYVRHVVDTARKAGWEDEGEEYDSNDHLKYKPEGAVLYDGTPGSGSIR